MPGCEHKTGAAVSITPQPRLFIPGLRCGSCPYMLIQHARDCLLGGRADHALFFSAVLEENKSGDAFDAEALRDRRIIIHIKLHNTGVAGVFFSYSLDGGRKHATWRAPRRPKIYQNRT